VTHIFHKKLYFIILWIPNLSIFANWICGILVCLCEWMNVCVSAWMCVLPFFLRIIYGAEMLHVLETAEIEKLIL
jgi:hypothetical protein